ncbi:TonB-dependent receptor plug domain-containing protein [Wenzhouxiangella sp. AB-CW3]|uniref:TonB-dependent receptor plug domain-containing protein n=1 Tax=Wenzhouxiangella sp. AB-CW3 TaxID=2771012 RepID=UPI00168ACCD0|nr:TonB-dependent receptor [Wenzhouxiangella sp. AB-CW3]QOC23249.1 TonB-dependent receptor plug domain-containing protein [Wenzhouxiangella sp. AB-CW3]
MSFFQGRMTVLMCFSLMLLVLSGSVPADSDLALPDNGKRVYTPEDFQRYAPRTALDMLEQVPSFLIRQQVQERGLGQATGNVLINGQRMSGKSNEVISELGRIPVSNVIRIEIVDASTLDVPGLSGLVANVVISAERISGRYAWRPEFRPYNTQPRLSNFEVSASGQTGRVEYSLGLDNLSGHGGADGPTLIFDGQGDVIERREEQWNSRFNQPRLSGRFKINDLGDSVANINLLYRRIRERFEEDGTRSGPSLVDRERQVRLSGQGYNYELGADYEFGWGPGRLKLIGLTRGQTFDFSNRLLTDYAEDRPDSGSRFDRRNEETEHIVRSEYRLARETGEWQFSGETVLNRLESDASLFQLADGQFQPVPLPGLSAVVEEERVELMAGYNRPLGEGWAVQATAGGEYSRLEQVGAGGMTRHFHRPKGSLALAWKAGSETDVSFRLQRRVGQLNFGDFLASVDLFDDVQDAANPDLRPPQTWELETELSTEAGEVVTTTLRAFVHRIDDIVDIIPIGESGESPGNIDRAWRYGAEWSNTIRLETLGWEGGRIDTRLLWQDSRVEDPLTGETRAISNSLQNQATLGFRSDPPGSDWGWGIDASYAYQSRNVRLTEQGRMWEGPVWASLYLEHRDVLGHTVRATVGNLLGARSMWNRTVHEGRRTEPIAFIEERDRRIGPIFTIAIQGEF